MSNWKEYSKTLPLAEEICLEVFGKPTTHEEWVRNLNKTGDINKILQK